MGAQNKDLIDESILASRQQFPLAERHDILDLLHASDKLPDGQTFDIYYVSLEKYIKALKYLEWAELKITALSKGQLSDTGLPKVPQ